MKKALLVDDDYLVRKYLRTLPSWEKTGFDIVADVRDGEEALEVLEKESIDLVVTDIAMPLVNGIELIREIRKKYKQVYIMVLSCHDDFESVKKAMKEGANEYILKTTLDEDSLFTLLAAAMEHMQENTREEKTAESISEKTEEERNNNKYLFFNQVLSGTLKGEEREQKRLRAGIHGAYQNSAVVVMKLEEVEASEDPWAEIHTEQYCRAFLTLLQKEMQRSLLGQETETEIIYLGNGIYCCFIDLSGIHKGSVMYQKLTSVASACFKICGKEQKSYKIGVSNTCLGSEALRQAYQQARDMIKLCFYEPDHIAYYEAEKRVGKRLPGEAEEFLSHLNTFKYGDDKDGYLKMVSNTIHAFKRELTESNLVIQWLRKVHQAAGINEEERYAAMQTIEEVKQSLLNMGQQLFEYTDIKIAEHVSKPVRIAAEYAAVHFREVIGLGDAADAAGVNSTYLSYLFSQEMGIGFANYLLKLRMEHVKKLLSESNLKMREVSEKAGFHDYHYFSKVFKKMNGVSPAEYRKEQEKVLR